MTNIYMLFIEIVGKNMFFCFDFIIFAK